MCVREESLRALLGWEAETWGTEGSPLLKKGFCGPGHILTKTVAVMAETARIEK